MPSSRQLSGKTYVRFTNAWDVTYQPGTNGKGDAVTDVKFYNDALTLRGKLVHPHRLHASRLGDR